MNESPVEHIVEGTKRATVHFARAAYEVAAGLGALVRGVALTVRGGEDDDGDVREHVPVE